MHNAGFRALGLDCTYELRETGPEEAPAVLGELRRGVFRGVNVTTPLKTVFARAVKKDTEAARAGAVNTLWAHHDGVFGALTDVQGVSEPLAERGVNVGVGLVLGAGGAARAAVLALESVGLTAHVAARRPDQARSVLAQLQPSTGGEAVDLADSAALARLWPSLSVVVQAAPADLELPWAHTSPGLIAFDMRYLPRRTPFLNEAVAAGGVAIEGWEMLLAQGCRAFTLWSKLPAPVEVMRTALLADLESRPGGKS
jgi:shikimate dehydrogenase